MSEGDEKTNNMAKRPNGRKIPALEWDLSVNQEHIGYGNGNRKAILTGKPCTIRGPFWRYGRHVINIKIHKCGHVGIGIVDKAFQIAAGHWLGEGKHSWGTLDNLNHHQGKKMFFNVDYQLQVKTGDVVTVDVDLNNNVLNWAINGQYLSANDIAFNIPNQVAVAASLWNVGDCVEIIQHKYM
eukprot:UN09345